MEVDTIFDWIRNKLGAKEPDILIKRLFTKIGIQFAIYKEDSKGKEKLSFPIAYTDYFNLRNLVKKDFYLPLQILEDLWNSGQLEQVKEGDYLIKTEDIYDFEDEFIKLLGFIKDDQLEVKINSKLSVGSKNFSLDCQLYHQDYGYISNFNQRQGSFYPVDNEQGVLLSAELVKLLELVEEAPSKRAEQPRYLAKVKKLAQKIGASFDGYLESEDYYFPEELDAEVEEKSIDHLELKPRFNDLDDELNDEANKSLKDGSSYGVRKNQKGKSRRIFFDDNIKRDYQELEDNKDIKGSDVPKFINNPASFLPESVDLERFSDRVKGLKERVYEAQPYVRVKNSDEMDWFELDIGIDLVQEDDQLASTPSSEDKENELAIDDFDKLVQEAKEEGEEYVLWDDKWIKIPKDSEKFVKATKEVEELKEEGRVNQTKMPYVFDIYENVDRLEYNLTLLDLKKRLKEVGGLSYQRPRLLNPKYKLYPYQQDGYVWLNRLKAASLGGLLADDMGLGKTLQVISLMAKLKEKEGLGPSLVVAPATLLDNWKGEIHKFCPTIDRIYKHRGSNRTKDSRTIKKSEVVLTTYQTLVRDQVILGEIDWKLLVCDEVQHIKNRSTLASHAVKAQKAEMRLALTGTPIENGLSDLWSIVDYVQPGLLDSYNTFQKEFVEVIENSDDQKELGNYEKELKAKIKPIYLRRTKEGELKDNLPEKNEIECRTSMSKKQEYLYDNIRLMVKDSEGHSYLPALQQLLSLCSHPGLVEKDWETKSVKELITEGPKLQKLIEILEKIKSKDEKVLIFTIYRDMQYIIQRVVREKFKLDWIPIINGSSKRRVETVNKFNDSKGFGCMLLSPKAAGTGLNITGANHVVHYTRWWNPAVEAQATDRAYRIGQKKDVQVYYPIVTSSSLETIEEKLNRLLQEKKGLAQSIIVPNKRLEKEIKDEIISDIK
ncbi:SNF2 family DNA or RNA helicase [Orenia metallireducens]|uniref:Superfamily II DNA or RNA helicase, SNF2 family n=1 Tax=Orenia metallireducens TaxID=1413210 RepID=A0A285I204_9FIRM|nr:DEAD/DEAH box helicase [Orenia metallireducens]PRX23238.1 SNF2 family DNA or RNA helicase [Orenia metallireducens]SNY41995.1 Superfamily II DNA or RNA helicase, SNF2 family [Orenia metallireducens]